MQMGNLKPLSFFRNPFLPFSQYTHHLSHKSVFVIIFQHLFFLLHVAMTYPLIITLPYPTFSVNFQPYSIYSDLSHNPTKRPYRSRLKIRKTGTTFLSYRLKPLFLFLFTSPALLLPHCGKAGRR